MRSTIFNFRMNLEDANYLYLISDSIFPVISFNYTNKLIVDRKDYSIKTQIRLLSDGDIPQYNDIYGYCEDNKECLIQTLFYGYFGSIAMVNFDIESGDGYKPEFLLNDSEYIDILKIKGYEFYGFVSNKDKFLIREYNSKAIIDASGYLIPLYSHRAKYWDDTLLYPGGHITTYLRYPVNYSGIGNTAGLARIIDFPRYPIISSDYTSSISVWSEKNDSFDDETTPFIEISVATFFTVMNDGVFRFATTLPFVPDFSELTDYVSNFGIILHAYTNLDILYGNNLYLEITI